MSRKIKFRAWSYEDEKMYYSPEMHDWDGFDAWLRLDCEDNDIGEGSVKLMQYTGLKDKNGKEIYEGDIVKYRYRYDKKTEKEEYENEVMWNDEFAGFEPFVIYDNDCCYYVDLKTVAIFGNIYENPELVSNSV